MRKKKATVRFSIDIDAGLHAELVRQAEVGHRSLNKECEMRLMQSVKTRIIREEPLPDWVSPSSERPEQENVVE